MIFCYFATIIQLYVRINQHFIDPGCQRVKASMVCLAADLWLKFEEKVEISRNWTYWETGLRRCSCTIAYSFTISYECLVASQRNRTFIFKNSGDTKAVKKIKKDVNFHLAINNLKGHAIENSYKLLVFIIESRIHIHVDADWELGHQL